LEAAVNLRREKLKGSSISIRKAGYLDSRKYIL
jgi:hypothetical protein